MSTSHQLLTLSHGLADTHVLFQHRSRMAQAAFAELLQRWADARGRRFAATHLDPHMRLLESTCEELLALPQALEAAARQAQVAEEHLAHARVAASDVEQAQEEADRLTARVRQLVAQARDRIQSADSHNRSMGVTLKELTPPPA
jgi:hypothetical protein